MSVRDFGVLVVLLTGIAGPAWAGFTVPADLAVAKTGPAMAAADSDVVYTVTLSNLSPEVAGNVQLSDTLPGTMTFVSLSQTSGPGFVCTDPGVGNGGTINCTIATLAGNTTATFDFTFHIPAGTAPGTFFSNIATVTSAFDDNEENNSATAVTQTPPPPLGDLSIGKSAPSSIAPDADLSFSLTLTNAGPDAASNVVLTDNLPAPLTFVSFTQNSGPAMSCGPSTCTIASFPAGSTATFVLTGHVPPGTATGTVIDNTVTVTSDNDPNDENNSGTTATVVSSADVSVNKTAPANITAGQDLSYTVTLSNAGPDPALSATWSDVLPAPLTFVALTQDNGPVFSCIFPEVGSSGTISCSIAALAAGTSAQFTLVTNVPATYVGPALVNTALASSESSDPDNTDNSSSATTAVTPLPIDLAVTKTGPATAVAGQNLSYALTLSNVGANAAGSVSLSDTMPAGTGFVSLTQTGGPTLSCSTPAVGANGPVTCTIAIFDAGDTATFDLVLSLPVNTVDGTQLTNTATASAGGPEITPGNNTDAVVTTVTNQADLSITKSAPGNAAAGATLAYTLTLGNAGPSNAQNVQLNDTVPANTTFQSLVQNTGPAATCGTPAVGGSGTVTCTFASLASGATATFTLTTTVAPGAPNGTVINNTATISASTADPNNTNNTSSTTTTVTNQADLAITKAGPATVAAGSNVSYTVTVSYSGAAGPASNVQWSDTLPSSATFVSLNQSGGPSFTCTTPAVGATGAVNCTIASFANASVATFTLVATVPTALANGAILTNTATTSTTSADANAANNTASSSATVSNVVDLALTKAGPASLQVGQNATYTLTLTNTGTSPAITVQLTDVMPAGTSFVSFTQNSGPALTCATPAVGANGTITCTTPSFAAGATATFTLVLGTTGMAPGALSNTASVTSASQEGGTGNNAGTAGTVLLPGVVALPNVRPIPALSLPWLMLLAGTLAAVAVLATKRRL